MTDLAGLDSWLAQVSSALGLSAPDLPALSRADRDALLDMTRDVAHGVYRPAAPLTAYLIGVAVGQGAQPQAAAATVSRLAAQWTPPHQAPHDDIT